MCEKLVLNLLEQIFLNYPFSGATRLENVKLINKYFLDTSVKSSEKLFSAKMDLSILPFTLHVKVIKIGHQNQYRIHASVSHFLNSIALIFRAGRVTTFWNRSIPFCSIPFVPVIELWFSQPLSWACSYFFNRSVLSVPFVPVIGRSFPRIDAQPYLQSFYIYTISLLTFTRGKMC